MGNNKTLFIILGVAVVLLVVTLMSGALNFSEGEDPATQLARQRSGGTSTPAPAPEPAPQPAPEPAAAPVPTPAAGGASADAATAAPVPAGEETTATPAGEMGEASTDVDADVDAADPAEGGEEAAGLEGLDSDELFEEDVPDDPIQRFKDMDPRDIIERKYDDLEERLTEPWNEEGDGFIPQTGRVDPLTRVFDAVPDDLKPPRSGETDASQIQTYLVSLAATEAVNSVALSLVCHNVLQIGLQKYASFSFGGDPTQASTIPEGQGFGIPLNFQGIGVTVNVTVTSISQDQVVVNLSATGNGVDVGVSKTQYYIPAKSV